MIIKCINSISDLKLEKKEVETLNMYLLSERLGSMVDVQVKLDITKGTITVLVTDNDGTFIYESTLRL